MFTELEFKNFANRVLNKDKKTQTKPNPQLDLFALNPSDGTEAAEKTDFETIKTTPHKYKLIDNEEDARNLCDFLMTNQIVSLDTETTSVTAIEAELVGLSFCVKEHEAYYVAIPSDREKAQRYVDIFKPLYESETIEKVGQNLKYDLEVLSSYGVTLHGRMFDTMIAHYLIQPELYHNMDFMAEAYLHYQTIHIEELLGPKGKKQKNMRELPPSKVYEYAAEDADITLRPRRTGNLAPGRTPCVSPCRPHHAPGCSVGSGRWMTGGLWRSLSD